jgi:hypothetical protein
MKKESTAIGVNPEQLQRLFNIGRDTKTPDKKMGGKQKKAEMLRRWLSQTLPLDKSQTNMLPAVLGQLCHTMGVLAGETIVSLLHSPSTDISLIERIKQYGKELSSRAESKAEHEAATALYYAAIAHALVFHGERITRFSYKKLENSFSRLVKEKWISKELSVLFKIAGKYCKEKVKS